MIYPLKIISQSLLDGLVNDANTTIITRRDAEDAVGMSLDCTSQKHNSLIEIVHLLRSPFEGIGKPEPLKENLSGFWSRRIDDTNRLVYAVDGSSGSGLITVISCRYHY